MIPFINLDEKKIIPNFVWGVNKKQIIYETKILYWSERAKNLALSQFKDLEEKILVSGGIGFDYYKIKKASIKIKNKINIGIGCWDFGPYLDINDSRFESRNENYTEKVRNRFITDSYKFNQIFHEIVAKYKNIHFTFKEHPGNQIGENASAIQGLKKFENVTVINKEKSLVECISESDLWIVYESTTALEAWLLDKKTLLVNPSGTDFTRDITFKGSPNAKDVKELELILNKIILNLNFEEFDIKSNIRNKIIKDVIQYEDGLNHVRAGNFLIAELENNNQSSLITKKTNYSIMIKEIIKKILHKFKIRKIKELKNFDYKKINKLNKTILLEQKQFYKNNDLSKIDLFKYKCS